MPGDHATVPAIALTAYARVEDRIKAIHAGYQLHLSKPVEPVELVAIQVVGYGLRDWNLRAIFHRIWEEQKHGWKSWAIRQPLKQLSGKDKRSAAKRKAHELEQDGNLR